MDLQLPQVPGIEIVFAQAPEKNQSPKTSRNERVPSVVDEILSIPTSKKNLLDQLRKSKSSSSEDESLASFNTVRNTTGSIIHDLQETLHTLQLKNTEDHLQIFQHMEKVNAERKLSTEFNQQMREDIGLLKTKIDNIEKLYKILNDGLTAAQQNEALRNQKIVAKENESKIAKQQLDKTLQQMQTNGDLYAEVKQQYNEQATRIEELKQQYIQLAATHPLLNQIMSTPRLNSARTPQKQASDSSQDDQMTLEDILTQQQQELLEMGKVIQKLNMPKEKPDYQKLIDNLATQVSTLKKENLSLMRRVQLWMTASTAVLLAGVWFWWQTHRA